VGPNNPTGVSTFTKGKDRGYFAAQLSFEVLNSQFEKLDSFFDLVHIVGNSRMKNWVSLVFVPVADTLPVGITTGAHFRTGDTITPYFILATLAATTTLRLAP